MRRAWRPVRAAGPWHKAQRDVSSDTPDEVSEHSKNTTAHLGPHYRRFRAWRPGTPIFPARPGAPGLEGGCRFVDYCRESPSHKRCARDPIWDVEPGRPRLMPKGRVGGSLAVEPHA